MTEETAAPEAGGDEAVAEVPEAPASARDALSKHFAEGWDTGEPASEPASEATEEAETEARARDEKGRFAPAAPVAEPDTEKAEADNPAAKPAVDAPPGFSEAGKAAWAQTPDHVKADVARRFSELENGLKTYQADYGEMKEYAALAKEQGTTLKAAMDRYVGMERMLASDPKRGLMEIAKNIGVDLGELAGQQTPPDVAQVRQEAQTYRQQAAQFQQEAQRLQAQINDMMQDSITKQIETFKADRPRFAELEPVMARLITSGVAEGLDDAYAMADRLNPAFEPVAPPAPQTRTPTSRSVAGAPPTGSNPAARKPASSAREALQRAFGG